MNHPPQIFIIYSAESDHHKDRVLDLSDRLRKEGIDCYLDQYETSPPQGWARWRREQIEQADYILVVCTEAFNRRVTGAGPAGLEKAVAWERTLIEDAIYQTAAQNRKVIPVLFSPEDQPHIPTFLGTVSFYVLDTIGYLKLYRHLTNQPETIKPELGILKSLPPKSKAALPTNPYRGLEVFRKEHKENFFGRTTEIKELQQLVEQHRLVAVIGASGSGKSSLVLAGLVPALEATGKWVISEGRPKTQPFDGLATALVPWLYSDPLDQAEKTKEFAQKLNSGNIDLPYLVQLLQPKFPNQRFLLIIDQFEEVFTLTTDIPLQQRFLDRLLEGVQAELPLTLLFTLRADFMGQVLAYAPLATALDRHAKKLLSAMDTKGLREAIEAPAKCLGVSLETGLTQRILDDVGKEPGNLPLLEFALTKLWEKQQYGDLTHAAYEEIGGVQKALALYADDVYKAFDAPTQAQVRQVFLRLVHPGEGTGDTRQVATRDQVRDWPLVKKLADARLVVTGQDEKTQQDTVEVVHEALIRHWQPLQEWVKEDRKFLVWLHDLRHREKEWRDQKPPDDGLLLRGFKLGEAQEKLKKYGESISDSEKAFIEASVALLEREKREKQAQLERERLALQQAKDNADKLAEEQRQRALALQEAKDNADKLATEQQKLANEQRKLAEEQQQRALASQQAQDNAEKLAKEQQQRAEEQQQRAEEQTQTSRKLSKRAKWLAGIGLVAILLACLSVWFGVESDRQKAQAELAKGQAQQKEKEAKAERDKAFTTQSLFLADLSHQQLQQSKATEAILLALEGLPVSLTDPNDRPWVPEAHISLQDAIDTPHELKTLVHEDSVNHAAFSPDGRLLVTASDDNTARLWDVSSGSLLQTLAGHEKEVWNAAFSPDGRQLVTASDDKTARLWDVSSGSLLQTLAGHESGVTHAAFSPDGRQLVTASRDNTARLWDVSSGRRLQTLAGHEGYVIHAAFSPDGRQLVTASLDKTARLWDVSSGRLLQTLAGHERDVTHAAFSPDGRQLVTASDDKTARLWDVSSGSLLQTLAGHQGWVNHAAFSPDGRQLVTASRDKTARLWDVSSGRLLQTLAGHEGVVWHAAFSPDGRQLVTASDDKTARLWDVSSGSLLQTLAGHESGVTHAAFSPDGRQLVTASNDKTARLWDVSSGSLLQTLAGHENSVWHAAFSPDGRQLVTASWDNTARLWDVSSGRRLQTLAGHESAVTHAAFSPDGRQLVTASWDNTARLWDVSSGRLLQTLAGHERSVNHAAFSPDGRQIVTASGDKTARLWDVSSGRLLQTLAGHESAVRHAAFSPDGRLLVTASGDKTARLWDVSSGRLLQTLAGHESAVTHAAFSPDGRQLVTASEDNTARLWDVSSGRRLQTLAGHESEVNHAAFSPDGRLLVTASWDNTARLWDVSSGSLLQTLAGHEGVVWHAAFSPDGRQLVTAPSDNTARLWDVSSGRLLQTLAGHEHFVNHAAFSPDGRLLVTASDDNTARLWRVFPPQELIDYAKKQVPRQLTVAQRKQFFLPIDPMMVEKIEKAKGLVEDGEKLATAGNVLAAIDQFKQALALDSSLGFQPESKAMLLVAQQARELAEAGKIPEATVAFQTVQLVQPFGFQLSVTPEVEAKRVAASAWVSQGGKLAGEGKIEEAMAKFKQALEWDPTSKEAKRSYASALVSKGKELAPQGQIDQALAKYTQAQQLDPEVEIAAESWDRLCYFGNFFQQAEKVLGACERAEAVREEETVERWVEGWLMGEE